MVDRAPLQAELREWREEVHTTDILREIRPANWIIDDIQIKQLSIVYPESIQMPADITRILQETASWSKEWSFAVFDVIHRFDNPPPDTPRLSSVSSSPVPTASPPHKRQRLDVKPTILQERTNYQLRSRK